MKRLLIALAMAITSFYSTLAFQFDQLIKPATFEQVKIKQFEDDGLAHYSYAIHVEDKMYLVDPGRDPQPYFDYALSQNAKIVGVINTHPHADFVSSHLEIHQTTGADIYVSSLVGAAYPHIAFDEGDVIVLPKGVRLRAIHTPGHSPDGISIVVEENGKDVAVFTGDTLFIGDVGRPDLRESVGNIMAKREELARMMYQSTREKLMLLDDAVVVYPAHGAGSLCGKAISDANSSTIGQEKLTNYALQDMTEDEFVALLLQDQPFIPKYFPYNVDVNKEGAPAYRVSKLAVRRLEKNSKPQKGLTVIDGRKQADFKSSHIPDAINIMNGAKFETWLGSLLAPETPFYLVAESHESLEELISKAAKIGYEPFIQGAFVYEQSGGDKMAFFDKEEFDKNPDLFTIIDIRNAGEVAQGKIFENAINIPLPELKDRIGEIPTDKPIVVHCGTGYRSAAGSSIIQNALKKSKVLDMSSHIMDYK
ncbi:MBL fold metallo-hydrolase [Cecembia calidifontis]|uniref:Glyoxylase-like metal-dependent hydrolase (Beta-lactamase superfamily II) n=1 Tax=Cecembia calidifontis TaxID=1187080 RepID=A0A4Q7PD53_9BACT|nr:MBL fold metallo-hydrolase [Cecembia calidifontis]RZS98007.1 glyoxylase-like metal-dependent hydrolase (beta-lactamase superfamily II) [Cecembia calidifontis]